EEAPHAPDAPARSGWPPPPRGAPRRCAGPGRAGTPTPTRPAARRRTTTGAARTGGARRNPWPRPRPAHRRSRPRSPVPAAGRSPAGPGPASAAARPGQGLPSRLVLEQLERVADQPEHGGPEADEQGPALGVVAVLLVDGLGPDPEAEAEGDRPERRRLQVPAAQAGRVQRLDQHRVSFVSVSLATAGVDHHEKEKHGSGTEPWPACRHRGQVAARDGPGLLALLVADDCARTPPRAKSA